MDTLGWILVQQGDYRRGVELLQKALAAAPDAAEIRWHLAYSLHKSGDDTRARQELERLINSGLAFGAESEARRLLAALKAKGR
jgi:Flp pilus assembly protein TadD